MDDQTAPTQSAPARTTVATYGNYREAERAVDFLSDRGFPVERAAIVGTGLKTVEQIAGRMTTGRAALLGRASGSDGRALLRPAVRALLRRPTRFLGVLLYGLVAGTVFGAIFGAIGQSTQGGRRDFASIQSMQAERYELQVDHEVSAKAKQSCSSSTEL